MTRATPYVDDALASLTRALNAVESDVNDDVRRHMLLCYEQLRAAQDTLRVEQQLAEVGRRSRAPMPLRVSP